MNFKYGDVVRSISSGDGSWDNPLERDLELIRNGILNGRVSIQRARKMYGVIVNEATDNTDCSEAGLLNIKKS